MFTTEIMTLLLMSCLMRQDCSGDVEDCVFNGGLTHDCTNYDSNVEITDVEDASSTED